MDLVVEVKLVSINIVCYYIFVFNIVINIIYIGKDLVEFFNSWINYFF